MACECPPIGQFPKLRADRDKDHRADDSAKSDQQKNCPGDRIMDELERPRQTGNDNQRQREYADDAVNQNRVSRTRPTGSPPARKKPNARTVTPNRRWQYLIKKCCNKAELQSRREGQTCTGRDGNWSPAKGQESDLSCEQSECQDNPAWLQSAQPATDRVDIAPTQRKIEEQDGDRRLDEKQKRAAHRRRVLQGTAVSWVLGRTASHALFADAMGARKDFRPSHDCSASTVRSGRLWLSGEDFASNKGLLPGLRNLLAK